MDAVDRALVDALRTNGRMSYAELGRLVSLSGPSVTDRINRLEAGGVITGYRAMVAPAQLGLNVTAMIGVLLSDSAELDDVAWRLRDVPEIEDCWFVAGEESYLLKVRAGAPEDLERIIGRITRRSGRTGRCRWPWRPRRSSGSPDGHDHRGFAEYGDRRLREDDRHDDDDDPDVRSDDRRQTRVATGAGRRLVGERRAGRERRADDERHR